MAGVPPEEAGPLREEEERRSAGVVGVTEVEFLDHRDGVLVAGPELRRDLAGAIRRHKPELVVTGYFGPTWTPPGGSPAYANSADHRALGQSVIDAVADAGNEWIFPDLTEQPWRGVQFIAVSEMTDPPHEVDVTDQRGDGGQVAYRAPPLPRAAVGHPGRGAGSSGHRHVDAHRGRAASGRLPALLRVTAWPGCPRWRAGRLRLRRRRPATGPVPRRLRGRRTGARAQPGWRREVLLPDRRGVSTSRLPARRTSRLGGRVGGGDPVAEERPGSTGQGGR